MRNISGENLYLISSDKNQATSTQRSGSLAKSPEELLLRCSTRFWMQFCSLVLAKACTKVFIKKEVVSLFPTFIDNIFFQLTNHPIASIWKRWKNRYGTDSVSLFKKFPFLRRVIRIEHLLFLFGLNKTARKNQKDVTLMSLLA